MVRLRLIVLKHRGFLNQSPQRQQRSLELIRRLNGFLLFSGTEGSLLRAFCARCMVGSCSLPSQATIPMTCHSKHFPKNEEPYRKYVKASKVSHRLRHERLCPPVDPSCCRKDLEVEDGAHENSPLALNCAPSRPEGAETQPV